MARLLWSTVLMGLSALGFRQVSKEQSLSSALTQEELDSLAWVPKKDRSLCEMLMAECKVNQTVCDEPCTSVHVNAFEGTAGGEFTPPEAKEEASLGDLVAIGDLAWTIIQDSKPVANVNSKYVSVIERDSSFRDYSGWRDEQSSRHRVVEAKSAFGVTTISVDVTLVFKHSGNYRGSGRYLENCYASPRVSVILTNTVDATASKRNPVNVGSSTNICAETDIFYQFNYGSFAKKWVSDWRFTFQCGGWWRMSPL